MRSNEWSCQTCMKDAAEDDIEVPPLSEFIIVMHWSFPKT